ncbi:hypothetical protein [Pontibacter sp. SGAir0037]|uniref:hypothetical protein n=1 Tax=Pontibacter sp. SGAir0037 TaxID=2571030 RepID=UPI0010F98EBF|nr:hypothetical protein [Pontibacter sp. SGAir0037]
MIKLNYDPATDILEVLYPDLHDYLMPEIKHSINTLVDTVKNYDIKKILLDSSRTIISVGQQESREIASYLASGLAASRLQKLARLQSASSTIEAISDSNVQYIRQAGLLPFDIQNFNNKTEAIAWLRA